MTMELWTDGSCIGNGKENNSGGWSYIIVKEGQIIDKRYGSASNTTNNRMEMQAVIEALKYALKEADFDENVIVCSDSAYVVNCIRDKWYRRWIANDWYNVKNPDLWKEILSLYESFGDNITFKKVKGHKGVVNNELCDMLARKGSEEARINKK